ncbi:MAG: hypothetical protein ACRD4F_08855, partial [Candidatus Angelobacter sp.]
FKLNNYMLAGRFLSGLRHPVPEAKRMLDLSIAAADSDPLEPRLAYVERGQRVKAGLDRASTTLRGCLGLQDGQTAQQWNSLVQKISGLKGSLNAQKLRRSPALVFASLDLIYQAEETANKLCGALSIPDQGLLLMAQKDRGAGQ